MRELDTITDLTAYLSKKEQLIRSSRLIGAGGEEDLVAYYMTHMSPQGEHDFTKPDGSILGEHDHIILETGIHTDLIRNAQYLAKKAADQDSYVWDRLIKAFTTHMLAGTSIVPDGLPNVLSEVEKGVRHMALVSRYMRRILGSTILYVLRKGKNVPRFTRAILPAPTGQQQDIGYFFMTLAVPKSELPGGYEQYRITRIRNLGNLCLRIFTQVSKTEGGGGNSHRATERRWFFRRPDRGGNA